MIHLSSIAVEKIRQDASSEQKPLREKAEWQRLLSDCRLSTQQLLNQVGLDFHPLVASEAEALFELKVPQPFIEKIEKGRVDDPLLLQVLPQSAEFTVIEGYSEDPLDERSYSPVKGLIHKYPSRVLLVTNQNCAINCRYCFRRSFPYDAHRQPKHEWSNALDYIKSKPEVNEAILSGGDPLTLPTDYLAWLLNELAGISQIKRVRIHSRLPVVLPQRIDQALLDLFATYPKALLMVVHSNHANEIGPDVQQAFASMRSAGVSLLNQSVLLKNVNDSPTVLAQLSERLFDTGVMPYYLFTLDKVRGAGHFDVSLDDARGIYKGLLGLLPGFLVPKLAAEIPGRESKSPIAPE